MSKKKKIGIVILALIIIGAIGSMFGGDSSSSDNTQAKTETKAKTYQIGDSVKVGKVVYQVKKKTITKKVGDEYVNHKAKDTYLILDVSIKNNDKEELSVSDSFFKVYNGEVEYETDSDGAIYLGEKSIIYQSVNPGVTLKGQVIFDIPEKAAKSNNLVLQVQTGVFGTETEKIALK